MVSIVLAGGGTAGHTSPLIATAQALLRLDPAVTITCIGTPRGIETRVVPEAGLRLELVPAVPLPRSVGVDSIKLPARLMGAVRAARRILKKVDADVVVGFGGYASNPAYLAARRMRIPVIVQEQNVLPGVANKVASRFATVVLTSFPGTEIRGARFEGMPLRASITKLARQGRDAGQREARDIFGLHPDLPVLLVSGGSQGARSLNNATVDATDRLLGTGIQILHVWGRKNYSDSLSIRTNEQTGARYVPVAYVDEMETAYAAADLMLARSGAGTVAETATVGLPTILVPLPIGNGEQARNSQGVVAAGAAIMIADAHLDADRLVKEVTTLVSTPGKLESMSAAGPQVMQPGAADRIASIILDVANRQEV